MSFVPLIGLVLASPVVVQAVTGERPVQEALVVWLVAMLLAMGGVQLWRTVTSAAPVAPLEQHPAVPRRRRDDAPLG